MAKPARRLPIEPLIGSISGCFIVGGAMLTRPNTVIAVILSVLFIGLSTQILWASTKNIREIKPDAPEGALRAIAIISLCLSSLLAVASAINLLTHWQLFSIAGIVCGSLLGTATALTLRALRPAAALR